MRERRSVEEVLVQYEKLPHCKVFRGSQTKASKQANRFKIQCITPEGSFRFQFQKLANWEKARSIKGSIQSVNYSPEEIEEKLWGHGCRVTRTWSAYRHYSCDPMPLQNIERLLKDMEEYIW